MTKKFGCATRAWRVLDCQKQVALNQKEFCSALHVAGYGGSGSVLWNLFGCKKTISIRDVFPDAWELIEDFRKHVKESKISGLKNFFFQKSSECSSRFDYDSFVLVCKALRIPAPYDVIFDLLDVKCIGSITWDEVKWIEEEYRWRGNAGFAVRKEATPLGGTRNAGGPARVTGIGHLGTEMKPRKVWLPKSNSLPDINPKLRPNWNERHTMFDTRDNATDQLIHLMKYVKVEDEIRIGRRVRARLLKKPTEQWLAENMPDPNSDEAPPHNWDDDDAEDESWALAHD